LFFISRLQEIYKTKGRNYKIASVSETRAFGSGGSWISNTSLVAAGTLAEGDFSTRDSFIKNYCPELKVLFPVLHDPHCFGASAVIDSEICASTICALRPKTQRRGGCV